MTAPRTAADAEGRQARRGASLAWRQVGYQLLLVTRSPLGTFTVLVVPLMLLGALNIVNPHNALRDEGVSRYADFSTPAMATFALLNAVYINVATSIVTAREAGVLKRLHSSPLPLWAYVAGRIGAAAVIGGLAFWVVMLAGALFLDVRLDLGQVAALMGLVLAGTLCFSLVGIALSSLVHSTESALPVAYGTFLPVAFISNIFFPLQRPGTALERVASAFPVRAISVPAEKTVAGQVTGWPMSSGQMVVLTLWTVGALLVTATSFSWEPGGVTGRLRSRWRNRLRR